MLTKRAALPPLLPHRPPLTSTAYNRRVCIHHSFTLKPTLFCSRNHRHHHRQQQLDDYEDINDFTILSSTDDDHTDTASVATTSSRNREISVATGFDKLKAQKLKVLAARASNSNKMKEKVEKSEHELDLNERKLLSRRNERNLDVDDGDGSDSDVSEVSGYNFRGWGNRRAGTQISSSSSSSSSSSRRSLARTRGNYKVSSAVADDFFSTKSFREIGCSDFMMESLKAQLFLRPSHIQAMAFGPVIEGKSCVIADQSGSGKTLAYLIPLIQRIRQDEIEGRGECLPRCPRVVVFVPTAELASQVLSNCRSMAKLGVPFRSMVLTGGFRQRTQLENLEQGVDVLISTPGRFLYLFKEGFLQLTNLKCVVFDEVDILFNDEEFEAALQSLINSSPLTAQYLFVTATLPIDVYNKLIEVFPDCKVVMGPGMHRTSARLKEVLVDCSGEHGSEKTPEAAFLNKKSALLQLVEGSPVSKMIIFCNKIETCRKVENALKRFDRKSTQIRILPFHAAVAQGSRIANMKEFMSTESKEDSKVLICTDRASRGIDFTGVDHVVLFDFPRDPSEYVRRVGRTARGAGGKGTAYIFVVGKQVPLAQKIIERNQKGHPLHDVPSAYELMG